MELGVNKDKAHVYHEHLKQGKYIVTIFGDKDIAEKAQVTLHMVGHHIDLQHHQ